MLYMGWGIVKPNKKCKYTVIAGDMVVFSS